MSETIDINAERARVFRSAEEHGSYLIGRTEFRERRGVEYEACNSLVETGHARWLDWISRQHPGIVLTGKPLDAA